ncbi:MAG: DUF7343 domain-containing protein [Candidatus Thorarchaeota archaeon]
MVRIVNKRLNVSLIIGFAILTILALSTSFPTASAQSQEILLSNTHIRAVLGYDCGTSLFVETNVTNTGSVALDQFDVRLDIRELEVSDSRLDGAVSDTLIIPEDRYTILRVIPDTPIQPLSSQWLSLNLTTSCLQESIGLNTDGSSHLNHLIYYIRPLNEIRNLTFSAALPAHAHLQSDTAAPLFPKPTSNYTDGFQTYYVWETSQLLPGQEIAYFIKYEFPVGLTITNEAAPDVLMIGIFGILAGAIVALTVERIPRVIKELRRKDQLALSRVSNHEDDVLKFLSKKGGSCLQKDIYYGLDMTQSMASMILTTLEERGLIGRRREGRENIVYLVEE